MAAVEGGPTDHLSGYEVHELGSILIFNLEERLLT
jgi:hypothetical protein